MPTPPMPIVPEGKPLASHIVDIENIRFNLDTPTTIGSFCQVPENVRLISMLVKLTEASSRRCLR